MERELTSYCERKVPLRVRDRVRWSYVIRDDWVTLYEERVIPGHPEEWIEIPMAQCRCDAESGEWTLYYGNRDTNWRRYRFAEPARNIGTLLQKIDTDTLGFFYV